MTESYLGQPFNPNGDEDPYGDDDDSFTLSEVECSEYEEPTDADFAAAAEWDEEEFLKRRELSEEYENTNYEQDEESQIYDEYPTPATYYTFAGTAIHIGDDEDPRDVFDYQC